MAKRCILPPDDIADWHAVLVSPDLGANTRSSVIIDWIEEEISGRWYMSTNLLQVNGYDYLLKEFRFQTEEDRMWFAMRWS